MSTRRTSAALSLVLSLVLGCGGDARPDARELYLANCAPCHGERADGKGPRHEHLDPPPRDYTDPEWRAQATLDSVRSAIRGGVPMSSMPAWDMLSEKQIEALAEYVLSVAEGGVAEAPE